MGRPNASDSSASPSEPLFLGLQKLPSVAGGTAPITGKLSFSSPTRIDGPLRGEVRSSALLVVGEHGSVDGTLRASELLVLGIVRGDVHGVRRIEIAAGGRVYGRVETRALIVNEGGILDAECRILSGD